MAIQTTRIAGLAGMSERRINLQKNRLKALAVAWAPEQIESTAIIRKVRKLVLPVLARGQHEQHDQAELMCDVLEDILAGRQLPKTMVTALAIFARRRSKIRTKNEIYDEVMKFKDFGLSLSNPNIRPENNAYVAVSESKKFKRAANTIYHICQSQQKKRSLSSGKAGHKQKAKRQSRPLTSL
jgi:hypothetical protein